MNFTWFYSKKVAFSTYNKQNLSHFIIRIGQMAVAIGIIISLITVSVGLGTKKEIKAKLANFNGHITVKSFDATDNYNSTSFNKNEINQNKILQTENVNSIQYFASKSGIIRTKTDFEGVIFKGLSDDFDKKRLQSYITEGKLPIINKDSLNFEVLLSNKIANALHLKVGESFLMYFLNDQSQKPTYRKFKISGLYTTNIIDLDNSYIVGDIQQIQRLNKWNENQVSGAEIYLNDIEKLDESFGNISKYISLKLNAETAIKTFSNITDWLNLFDNNIYVILALMMIVVAINMVMIFLILIIEKTQTIGLLKVLGTSNTDLIKIFIFQSLFIMIPGIILGNIIGLGFLFIQKYFNLIPLKPENYYLDSVPVYLDFGFVFIISGVSILISVIVLLLPSFIIAKISPIKAIRFD